MIEKQLIVTNELGIHARVASKITRCCQGFSSRIEAMKEGRVYNLKNVLAVMTLNVKYNESVLIQFEGDDEEAAVVAVEALFAAKFNEK
jgi:phosphotransferase system HPr (HPr) family protein